MKEEIDAIIKIIDTREEKLNNRELLEICKNLDFLKNGRNPHFCHEIAETSLNYLVKQNMQKNF